MTNTCPHCGAAQIDNLEFECGSKTYANIRGEDCYDTQVERLETEIARLRDLLDNPKAKPLEWEDQNGYLVARAISGRFTVARMLTTVGLWRGSILYSNQESIEAAQAHAEELHQAAFAEFVKKWGKNSLTD